MEAVLRTAIEWYYATGGDTLAKWYFGKLIPYRTFSATVGGHPATARRPALPPTGQFNQRRCPHFWERA
jgi:hypothetical protein